MLAELYGAMEPGLKTTDAGDINFVYWNFQKISKE